MTDRPQEIAQNITSMPGRITPFGMVMLHIYTLLVALGSAFLFHNFWFTGFAVPIISFIWLIFCVRRKVTAGLWVFTLLSGLSSGIFLWLFLQPYAALSLRSALAFFCFSTSWFAIWILSRATRGVVWWWAVLPGFTLLGGAGWFLRGNFDVFDLVFYFGTAVGAGLLLWGIGQKLFGLIIAGCLTITMSPGVYFSWKWIVLHNILSQIGIMLVWFALGWGLITIVSRVINDKFNWWALIPCGVLAVVGLGLYLGGDPMIAEAVLSNSGVMGIILLAVYLALMRTRFKQK